MDRHRTRRVAPLLLAAAIVLIAPPTAAGGGGRYCGNELNCADVSISGHAEPQPIKRGGTSELKITPKNDGPSPAYGIDVQVDVPRELKILDVRMFGGRSCSAEGTFVRCDFGDFRREQLGVVRIEVKGKKRGTFISDAKVYSQGIEDPNGGNNQVSMTIAVGKAR